MSCGGLQQHSSPGARRAPRVLATGPPSSHPARGGIPKHRAAHLNGSGQERGAGGGAGLREPPGPEDAAAAVAEPGPGRARRGSGVGLARGRRRHTDTIELRFPVAAAASAAASPASASRPGTHTHSDLRAVSILGDVSSQTANGARALVRTMGGNGPMSEPGELAVANRRRADWRVMLFYF